MSIEIRSFQQNCSGEWDDFVWNANNGTLFHTRKFLEYHPPERFTDHSLCFYDGNKKIALFPAIDYNDNGKRVLISHRGASYGGFVIKDTLSYGWASGVLFGIAVVLVFSIVVFLGRRYEPVGE